MAKKLSGLLYTNGEDDWSDFGLDKIPTENPTADYDHFPNDNELPPEVAVMSNSSRRDEPVKKRTSLPATIRENPEHPVSDFPDSKLPVSEPEIDKAAAVTEFIRSSSRNPGGYDGYGEGVPVLNRKTSAPVMPYVSQRASSEDKDPVNLTGNDAAPAVRRKSSELSSSMKSRLEAFTASNNSDPNAGKRIVEPDNTFREKLQTFRKISEPKPPENDLAKGPKPPLSYKTLIGNNFTQYSQQNVDNDTYENREMEESIDNDMDDVDQLLDDALEESYRSVLEGDSKDNSLQSNPAESSVIRSPVSGMAPPTEKPPPPPVSEIEENQRNLKKSREIEEANEDDEDYIDQQEQEIIASLELEEREHKKYMDTVNAMRNLSPTSSATSEPSNNESRLGPQPFGKKSVSPTFRNVSPALSASSESRTHQAVQQSPTQQPKPNTSLPAKKKSAEVTNQQPPNSSRSTYNQQHWLIQEAEQRRISEQQIRHYQNQQHQASPVYENSNYISGVQMPGQVPPPNQYTNHQRPQPPPAATTPPSRVQHQAQQPSPNENMYANLGQHPPLPPNYQRDIPPGPPTASNNMRGLPGPQVPPRNPPAGSEGASSNMGGSSDRLLSVSGKKKCSHCKEELGRGAAMIIESLRLFYHLRCFRCVVCHVQLGNGSSGTDVRVRNNKLHCQNCYSNDEGLKFSKV